MSKWGYPGRITRGVGGGLVSITTIDRGRVVEAFSRSVCVSGIQRSGSQCVIKFPIIQLPEYIISTVLFARQYTSYTHKPMETSFHPSLTLVPSLANYSLSLYTPSHWGVSLSPHLSLHSTFWRSREDISLYRCFCAFVRFPYEYNLLVLLMTLLYRIVS